MEETERQGMYARKRARIKSLGKTKSYPLNPIRQYERDMEMILRNLAKFIAKRGFCPTAEVLARRHTWILAGTKAYLEDMLQIGWVELYCGSVWKPTDAGWDAIEKIPIEPLLPPEMSVKATSIREARFIARRLADPEVAAAYEAFCKEMRESPTEQSLYADGP